MAPRPLMLREWEIWHTYSTFFTDPIPTLEKCAYRAVEQGFAHCVVSREGTVWCRASSGSVSTFSMMVTVDDEWGGGRYTYPANPSSNSDVRNMLHVAASLKFEELRHSGEWHPDYIRLFLRDCWLQTDSGWIRCSPVVKLFGTGAVIVSLRICDDGAALPIETFIAQHVNLFRKRFSSLKLPADLLGPYMRAERQESRRRWSLLQRYRLYQGLVADERVEERTRLRSQAGQAKTLIEVDRGTEAERVDDLSGFALSLVRTLAWVIVDQTSDARAMVFGYRPALRYGDYWTGRPYIHVLRHSRQGETAKENENQNRHEFGWIMARHFPSSSFHRGGEHLPPTQRAFDDHAVYLNIAVGLWVWAREGVLRTERRLDLIGPAQVIAELIEYGAILHNRLLYRASAHSRAEDVLAAKRELALLRTDLLHTSRTGEVRSLLRYAWEQVEVEEARSVATELLEVRSSETALSEARTLDRRNRLLTFTFGLVAVPPVASDIVLPLWRYLGWWRPATDEAQQLIAVGVALGGVGLALTVLSFWIRIRSPELPR